IVHGGAANYFAQDRKLFKASPRLYMQDHSRGRGLTTTGQPTVSLLPLNALNQLKLRNLLRVEKQDTKIAQPNSPFVAKIAAPSVISWLERFVSWEAPETWAESPQAPDPPQTSGS